MDRILVEQVWERARDRCEYCRVPQEHDQLTFEIEHIISKKHRGKTILSNLALACFADNRYKGTDVAARDPRTRKLVPLFNPRRHKWHAHFQWNGPYIVGRTSIGRATVALLKMNIAHRVKLRHELIDQGILLDSRE